jgi:hypothetical protein
MKDVYVQVLPEKSAQEAGKVVGKNHKERIPMPNARAMTRVRANELILSAPFPFFVLQA